MVANFKEFLSYKCILFLAPGGCLQFHQSPHGRVTSFNSGANDGHLSANIIGLNYGVCVRRERGFCAIRVHTLKFLKLYY